jgi:hypothetical protein
MAWSARRQQVVFVTLMVLAMSFVISLAMAVMNLPLDERFLARWLKSWLLAILVAWPTAYIVVPSVRRIVAKLAK